METTDVIEPSKIMQALNECKTRHGLSIFEPFKKVEAEKACKTTKAKKKLF